MQVVHLFDVAAHELKYLTDTSGKAEYTCLTDFTMTHDSSMALVAFETCDGALLEVHSRSGQLLQSIRPEHVHFDMTVACLINNRAATSNPWANLVVWDLLTGQQVSAIRLRASSEADSDEDYSSEDDMYPPEHASLMCADKTGARLACIAPDSTLVHMFDAVTLDRTISVCPPAGMGPCGGSLAAMQMKAFHCLLLAHREQPDVWHVCRLEPGTGGLRKVLQFENVQLPTLSEDEAFIACLCRGDSSTIQVFDTRSGDMVFVYRICLSRGNDHLKSMAMTWVSSRLLIQANIDQLESRRATDHIIVLQF